MEVRTASDLRFVVESLTRTLEIGAEAERLLSSMLGIDEPLPSGSGGAFDVAVQRGRSVVKRTLGIHPRQVGLARAALSDFATSLLSVPSSIDFALVGRSEAVVESTRAVMTEWASRMETTGNRSRDAAALGELRNEVAASLADLKRAEMLARLCAMRLRRSADG